MTRADAKIRFIERQVLLLAVAKSCDIPVMMYGIEIEREKLLDELFPKDVSRAQ